MSLQNRHGRISVRQFASLPSITLADMTIPEVKRGPVSITGSYSSGISTHSHSSQRYGVPLEEGCIITKSVRYTHQLTHFVNALRNKRDFGKEIEAIIEQGLKIVPYDDFRLDDSCNLVFLDPFVHASLDLYALVALTPSLQTVVQLICDVRSDNERRQKVMDTSGVKLPRSLNFCDQSFTDPEYELVVLHPEHLLPGGDMLTIYDRVNNTYRNYVVSDDRCLRESADPNSARLPPFRHDTQQRDGEVLISGVNIFLVALNAEIKFRRYSRMTQVQQLPDLPPHVMELISHVIELVDLLYWQPVPTKGSKGEGILIRAEASGSKRKNPPRAAKSDKSYIERSSRHESTGEDLPSPPKKQKWSERLLEQRRWLERWRNMDFETRRAYGTALICGHDKDYDPALFEDAFPVNDMYEAKPVYSAKESVEAWRDIVSEESEQNSIL